MPAANPPTCATHGDAALAHLLAAPDEELRDEPHTRAPPPQAAGPGRTAAWSRPARGSAPSGTARMYWRRGPRPPPRSPRWSGTCDVGVEEDVRQRRGHPGHQVRTISVLDLAQPVLDVVAEDPEEEHVAGQVQEAPVQEHRREAARRITRLRPRYRSRCRSRPKVAHHAIDLNRDDAPLEKKLVDLAVAHLAC